MVQVLTPQPLPTNERNKLLPNKGPFDYFSEIVVSRPELQSQMFPLLLRLIDLGLMILTAN